MREHVFIDDRKWRYNIDERRFYTYKELVDSRDNTPIEAYSAKIP